MEKWRIYLILAGIILVMFNFNNIDFENLKSSSISIVGIVSSVAFVIMLIVFRKK